MGLKTKPAKDLDYKSSNLPKVSIERLEQDIIDLSQIGRNHDDNGVYRPAFSEADMKARKWLLKRIEDAGLQPSMDGAGNVFGLDDQAGTTCSFLVGSHLDTVERGGVLDGAYGVLAALECARVIRENKIPLKENLEVIATSDEEGRFGGMLGAQAICGEIHLDAIRTMKDTYRNSLTSTMEKVGLNALDILKAKRYTDHISGFLEIHIEQGPVLDTKCYDIGVVKSISGIFKWKVTLIGESNHSGTTPMDMRKDSFSGLCEFSGEIPRILEENGSDHARATIGQVQLFPGNPHIIPGKTEFTFVGRDFTDEGMADIKDACRRTLSAISRRRGLMFEFEEINDMSPTQCHKEFSSVVEEQAQNLNVKYLHMNSGAGHDAQIFGKYVPMGMIFIPSLKGVSHSPEEWSSLQHIEMGANVLLGSILKLVGK